MNFTQKGPSWSVDSTPSIVPPPNMRINAVVFNENCKLPIFYSSILCLFIIVYVGALWCRGFTELVNSLIFSFIK